MSSEDKKAPDASSKRADYTRVVQAVKRLGFPDEAAHIIWRVLAAILHLGNMEFVAKVRTDRTVQQAGRHKGRRRACSSEAGRQVRRQKKMGGQRNKQAGMQTDSHSYRKLESVLTSRQQVISMEFLAKVRIGRTVHQAGRHRGRRWACSMQTGKHGEKSS